MKKFGTGFFAAFGVNMVVLFMTFAIEGFALLLLFTVPIGFLVGFLLLFFEHYREVGGGLMAASGVSLLVAGFVCSNATF
jgi:hypothetical protein